MDLLKDLSTATNELDDEVRYWMAVALTSRRHTIGAVRWESELALCPIAAAASAAGIWQEHRIDPEHSAWSQDDGPSPAVEEFAACFDLACEGYGLDVALNLVRAAVADRSLVDGTAGAGAR